MKLKSFKPQPLGETKIRRRYPKSGPASSNKIKRAPAKYDNPNWEETINKYIGAEENAESRNKISKNRYKISK